MNRNYSAVMKIVICVSIALVLITITSCAKKSPSGTEDTDSQSAVTVTPETEPVAASPAEPGQENPIEVSVVSEPQIPVSEEPQEAPASEAPAEESGDATDKSDWVPIKLELPEAVFVGTPEDLNADNLEKPTNQPRPPFLAPPGTENVALNKPVTSDHEPMWGDVNIITDGDKEAAEGHYIQMAPFKEFITIDLEKEYNIWAIVVWHYHMQPRVYFDVIVQVSDDPDFLTNVTTLFNNDNDNSYGLGVGKDKNYCETNEGKLIDGKGVKGRYVRLHSNKNSTDDLNHYIEVSVYGTPVE